MDHFEAQVQVEKKDMRTNSAANRSLTMPMANPSASAAASPLTIFYAGKVRVYNAIPPEKAQAIILIAGAAAAAAKASANGNPAAAAAAKAPAIVGPSTAAAAATLGPVLTRSLSLQSSTAGGLAQLQLMPTTSSALCKLQAELPMARRQSLQRFMEKRRDRLASKAPYASAKSSDMEGASEGSPQLN